MAQLEHIEAIEKRLWEAADTLRANSGLASNEYFMPVMGLLFLRHAYTRFLRVKDEIEPTLPTRGGKVRDLTKEDFSQESAIFLQPNAQFDYLVSLPDSEDRAKAISEAMQSIEDDYESLQGVLPTSEYQELENDVLGELLRKLNPDELNKVSGDVFGRIYEYFLTQFADQKAHDSGEFFTPISLVSLISRIIEPQGGTVLDPACGSGGMFVQSARIVEEHGDVANEKLTFRGLEKNKTTIQLAKMNLAVHGLEGDIQKAITYYEDPHELVGKANYVMANPPFNVDEIDAEKVKTDPRLVFGLPSINEGKVSNGNYIWISYFYSYLSEQGRAGFVMSSQASSAGNKEAAVRQKIIETGDVDVMVAISTKFFYTRSVPCELWFFNRDKPDEDKNKVLMLDARQTYRQVTKSIRDFSKEQEQNLLSIVWLYRGETDRYLELVSKYLGNVVDEGEGCFNCTDEDGESYAPIQDYLDSTHELVSLVEPFLATLDKDGDHSAIKNDLDNSLKLISKGSEQFKKDVSNAATQWDSASETNNALVKLIDELSLLAESSHTLLKQIKKLHSSTLKLVDLCEKEYNAKKSDTWSNKEISRCESRLKSTLESATSGCNPLSQVRYFWLQAKWLTSRFPKGKYNDVEGLVKLVDHAELEANDWSLSPGRYVGIAPEEVDLNFDFEEAICEIHMELDDLNKEAATLAATIKENFEGLGV